MKDYEKEFFPTTKKIAEIMNKEIKWNKVKYILEPSAGKGDLIKHLLYYKRWEGGNLEYKFSNKKVYGIEINPEFQLLLREKKLCSLIATDFLTYSGELNFDLIIMNPPFSQGVDHALKAWDIIKNGKILCILNKETYENPFSEKRKYLRNIIDKYGKVIDLGQPFKKGKKNTNVSAILVVLNKEEEKEEFSINFDKDDFSKNSEKFNINIDDIKGTLVQRDIVQTKVSLYKEKIKRYKEALSAIKKFQFFGGDASIFNVKNFNDSFNQFLEKTIEEEWKNIINSGVFISLMTNKVKEKFNKFIQDYEKMDFSEENIEMLIDTLMNSKKNIMDAAIIDVFDTITSYSEKNSIKWERWKTNDAYKVNMKFIIPRVVESNWNWSLCTYMQKVLNDIDRVMQYISGEHFNAEKRGYSMRYIEGSISHSLGEYLKNYGKEGYKENIVKSKFFKIKFFKKGTVHLEFLNHSVWQEFNLNVARIKKWLPEDYRPKKKDVVKI